MKPTKVTRINGLYLQWQSLLNNRTKRTQANKFVIQGVQPINAAIAQKLEIDTILYREGKLSDWAAGILQNTNTDKSYELSTELMSQLSEKTDSTAELILIARRPGLILQDVKAEALRSNFILVLDRPQSPGNIGAVARSADALGAGMVIVTGHAADIYDPKSVRASRGSLFALPIVKADSHTEVLKWGVKSGTTFAVIGLSEDGTKNLWDYDLKQPTIVIIGNETWGLSKQWQEACTDIALIPMQGTASSLNAASSAAITLYEYANQSSR